MIEKEILHHLLSLRFAILCIICLVVTLSSVLVLTRDYKEDLLDYHSNVVMHRNQVLAHEHPRGLFREGIHIDKPLNVMKIFLKGTSQTNSRTVWVPPWGEPQFLGAMEGNPLTRLFPTVDLVFFVSVIMSLLAMAFSYDAVSGEKESGTLRLMMSFSVPRDTILVGKWIGGYVVLVAPFLMAHLAGLSMVLMFPEVHLSGQDWLRLGAILAEALLFMSAVYTLGLLVSARTRIASTSITVLLLVWVLMALAIPNLSPYVAGQIAPIRSMQSVEKEKAAIQREVDTQASKEWNTWLDQRTKEGPLDWSSEEVGQFVRDLRERTLATVARRQGELLDSFKRQMARQASLAQNLSRLSPMSPFIYAATALSGTGAQERDHFLDQLYRYAGDWRTYSEDKIEQFRTQQRASEAGQESTSFDASDYPRFAYRLPALKDQLAAALPDLLILAAWDVILFMAAYLSFLRYDVR